MVFVSNRSWSTPLFDTFVDHVFQLDNFEEIFGGDKVWVANLSSQIKTRQFSVITTPTFFDTVESHMADLSVSNTREVISHESTNPFPWWAGKVGYL